VKLKLFLKDGDKYYDHLPDKMKAIIDNDQLILGIDLGTTSSCASVMIDNDIIMIRNSLGSTTTPSFISFINRNEICVGEMAKLLPSDERNIVYQIKRLMGKSFKEEEVDEYMKNFQFNFKKDKNTDLLKIELTAKNKIDKKEKIDEININNEIKEEKEININIGIKEENEIIINTELKEENKININNEIKDENEININNEIKDEDEIIEEFYPEQLCSLLLKKIIDDSEYYLTKKIGKNIKIKNCVLTVPARFNQRQREATLNSAKIMGLNVKTMINEPTAAILPYAYNILHSIEKEFIVVIDFGGGTLDLTLLKLEKDEESIYCDILSTYGDTNLGGEDFDKILMDKCIEKCDKNSSNRNTIFSDKAINQPHNIRLKRACERAKIRLSYLDSTEIYLENYLPNESIKFPITKANFIKYCKKLFDKFERIIDEFFERSEIKKNRINEVITIGGTTLIPKIREIINKKI